MLACTIAIVGVFVFKPPLTEKNINYGFCHPAFQLIVKISKKFSNFLQMPRKPTKFTCPSCNLEVSVTKNTATVKTKKSPQKQAAGRRLAAALPRDERGRFLPAGSTNRYKGKAKAGTRKRKTSQEGSSGTTSRRRRSFRGTAI